MALNVTLILTQHNENGVCNSDTLLVIVESINPEVIFEELSHTNHHKAYIENSLVMLESIAIKKYLKNHDVEHIPVDTYDLPRDYNNNLTLIYGRLTKSAGEHSFQFRGLLDQKESVINQYGFQFLNSDQNEKLFENIDILRERILDILNDEKLFRIARLEKEVIEKREDVILDNIYKYSKENTYNNAMLFIGSGHQKSMTKKITELIKTEETKVNWNYFSDLITELSIKSR
jgi:hypothetical protein